MTEFQILSVRVHCSLFLECESEVVIFSQTRGINSSPKREKWSTMVSQNTGGTTSVPYWPYWLMASGRLWAIYSITTNLHILSPFTRGSHFLSRKKHRPPGIVFANSFPDSCRESRVLRIVSLSFQSVNPPLSQDLALGT